MALSSSPSPPSPVTQHSGITETSPRPTALTSLPSLPWLRSKAYAPDSELEPEPLSPATAQLAALVQERVGSNARVVFTSIPPHPDEEIHTHLAEIAEEKRRRMTASPLGSGSGSRAMSVPHGGITPEFSELHSGVVAMDITPSNSVDPDASTDHSLFMSEVANENRNKAHRAVEVEVEGGRNFVESSEDSLSEEEPSQGKSHSFTLPGTATEIFTGIGETDEFAEPSFDYYPPTSPLSSVSDSLRNDGPSSPQLESTLSPRGTPSPGPADAELEFTDTAVNVPADKGKQRARYSTQPSPELDRSEDDPLHHLAHVILSRGKHNHNGAPLTSSTVPSSNADARETTPEHTVEMLGAQSNLRSHDLDYVDPDFVSRWVLTLDCSGLADIPIL